MVATCSPNTDIAVELKQVWSSNSAISHEPLRKSRFQWCDVRKKMQKGTHCDWKALRIEVLKHVNVVRLSALQSVDRAFRKAGQLTSGRRPRCCCCRCCSRRGESKNWIDTRWSLQARHIKSTVLCTWSLMSSSRQQSHDWTKINTVGN